LTTSDLLMMEKNNTWLGLPGGETLEAGVPVRVIPEEIVGRPLWEVFEDPDERILTRDPETSLGCLPASGVITVTMNTSSHSPASLPLL